MERFVELKSPVNGFHTPDSESVEYTSLRDLLPSPSSSPTPKAYSPAASSSWQELPIKNPLVKQAAIAYLQPMSNQTAAFGTRSGLFAKLREKCGCDCDCDDDFGCVSWLWEVVSRAARDLFGWGRRSDDGDDEDDDDVEGVDSKGQNIQF